MKWKEAPACDASPAPPGEERLMWQAYYVWCGRMAFVIEYHCCGRDGRVVKAAFCESDLGGSPAIRTKSLVLRLRRRMKEAEEERHETHRH